MQDKKTQTNKYILTFSILSLILMLSISFRTKAETIDEDTYSLSDAFPSSFSVSILDDGSIQMPSMLNLLLGQQVEISAPSSVIWYTADENIIAIADDGKSITATGFGPTSLMAQNGTMTYTALVMVYVPEFAVSSVTLNPGESFSNPVTYGDQCEIMYSSSDDTIATVSEDGSCLAVSEGTCQIQGQTAGYTFWYEVIVSSGYASVMVKAPSCTITKISSGERAFTFLECAVEQANIYIGEGYTYSNRRFNGHTANCANGVCKVLENAGVLSKGMQLWSDSRGNPHWSNATEAMFRENADVYWFEGGTNTYDLELKTGDVITHAGHMRMFLGWDENNDLVFFDTGSASTSNGKPDSGPYVNIIRADREHFFTTTYMLIRPH